MKSEVVRNGRHVLKKRLGQNQLQATVSTALTVPRPEMGAGTHTLAQGRRPKRGGRLLQLPPLTGSPIQEILARDGPLHIRVRQQPGDAELAVDSRLRHKEQATVSTAPTVPGPRMGAGSHAQARGRRPKRGGRLHGLLSGQRQIPGRRSQC